MAKIYCFNKSKLIRQLQQLMLDYDLTLEYCMQNENSSWYAYEKLLELEQKIKQLESELKEP